MHKATPNGERIQRLAPHLLWASWALAMLLLFRPAIHGIDTVGYYSWLRSVGIQGSLDVSDEFFALGYGGERAQTFTGYQRNEYPVGSAVMWAPFFALGHLVALGGNLVGAEWPLDGYSAPYLAATAFGSSLYALAGLWLLFRLLARLTCRSSALWACLTAFYASPLLFYSTAHPFMSHANDFALHALILVLWMLPGRPTTWRRGALGLVIGLAASVRLQNAILLLWPVGEEALSLARRRAPWLGLMKCIGATGAGALLGLLPQLVTWRVVYGQWLVLNPYGLSDMGGFNWASPHFGDVLFSTKGLFAWTPAYLLGVGGLAWLLLRGQVALPLDSERNLPTDSLRRLALFLLGNLALLAYVIGSWQVWTGAAAFGQRFLVSCVPALAVGLGVIYERWQRRQWTLAVVLVSALFVAWNAILLARYGMGDIQRSGLPTWEALTWGQVRFALAFPQRAGAVLQQMRR